VTAFGSQVNLAAQTGSSANITYMTMVQLKGVTNDPIYLFWRYKTGTTSAWRYSVSTDSGATWSSQVALFTGDSGKTPYMRVVSDWDTRIDLFVTDTQPAASTGLWHFYIDGSDGSYHQSDGTAISGLPFTVADLTLVEDNAAGALWSWGGSWDGTAPAAIIMQENGSTDNRIKVARWRTGAWQVDEVVSNVGGQLGINKYASGCAINHTNPDLVYYAKRIGSKFEQFRATSSDDGATWNAEQLTFGSAKDNVWVEAPTDAAAGLTALWLYGDYTNDTSFSFGIRGTI
jgi:hypothetical protein